MTKPNEVDVITGIKRDDVVDYVDYATRLGYEVEVTPYITPEIITADGELHEYYVTKYRMRMLRNAEEVER